MGWAAVRPVWGGTNFTNTTGKSGLVSGNINFLDTWSPFVILAGTVEEYGDLDNFTHHVMTAPLTADAQHTEVSFLWRERSFVFYPGPGTWKGVWKLPTVDGVPVKVERPYIYQSPHLNAVNTEVVTTTYDTYQLVYNFSDDSITRVV